MVSPDTSTHVQKHLAGVAGTADQPDGRRGICDREMSGGRYRQHAVSGLLVHRGQQPLNDRRMAVRQQRQVYGVERQVAAEWEQSEPGVAIDVTLADFDEPPAEGVVPPRPAGRLRAAS